MKMKKFNLSLLFCTLFLPILVFAQTKQVTLELNEVTANKFINAIQQQTNYDIVYASEDLNSAKKINYTCVNKDIVEVLNETLKNWDLDFKIVNDKITIFKIKILPQIVKKQEANKFALEGRVIDSNGASLVGATVIIKGTAMGSITDDNGRFQLFTSVGEVIEVSYVGMIMQSLTIENEKELIVTLQKSTMNVEDVVVTGYQSIKRERMTGTTSTITSADISNKGATSMDEVLAGTISGVNTMASGRPGEDAKIVIRGINSLTGSTSPMWIVDGMPLQGDIPSIKVGSTELESSIMTTGIGNIPAEDIQSITVLKDAAATAIYGAQAANGVIVVTTKSGVIGKTRFNISANFGVQERPINNIDMMDSQQKIRFERETYVDGLTTSYSGRVAKLLTERDHGLISDSDAEREISRLSQINTDWFKELFRVSTTQQYNISASGGSERVLHFMSLNYTRENGTQKYNGYDRLRMSAKLQYSPIDKVKIYGNIAATLKNDAISASTINPLEYAMYANPYERPYKEDGSYDYDMSYNVLNSTKHPGVVWDTFNILDDLERNSNKNRYIDAEASLKVEWEILKGLKFNTHGLFNVNSNNGRIVEGANTYTNYVNNWFTYTDELPKNMAKGSLRESTSSSTGYTLRNTLEYSLELSEKHYLNIFAGQEITARTGYTSFNYSPIFDEEHRIVGFPEMGNVDPLKIDFSALGGTGKYVSKLSSFFANASYSYMDKYIVSGAIRYDGSDIIGNDNQFTPLWNIGARWNIHRESWMDGVEFINELSLNGGFGYTGSIDKNALPFVVMTLGQNIIYDGQTVPTSYRYSNPNVKWQTKEDISFGLNTAMFDRRIRFSLSYYHNTTRDVLDNRSLALSSGRPDVIENVATILNEGVELDLGATIIRRNHWSWDVRANIAINKNRLSDTYYKNIESLPVATPYNTNFFVENRPVGGWYGYEFAGVDPMTGNTLAYDKLTGNKFDMDDLGNSALSLKAPLLSYLGDRYPPITGGIQTTVSYKNISLNANFEYKTGHMIKSFNTFSAMSPLNRHVSDNARWRQMGDITSIPKISPFNDAFSKYMYDVQLEKGDYFKCTFLSLAYDFNITKLNVNAIKNLRLSFVVKDLFTLTKYDGIDPILMGEYGYPNSRKYTLTLNIGF